MSQVRSWLRSVVSLGWQTWSSPYVGWAGKPWPRVMPTMLPAPKKCADWSASQETRSLASVQSTWHPIHGWSGIHSSQGRILIFRLECTQEFDLARVSSFSLNTLHVSHIFCVFISLEKMGLNCLWHDGWSIGDSSAMPEAFYDRCTTSVLLMYAANSIAKLFNRKKN